MCADIVVVGGGPVGCWTAIQIKKRNPELDVQVYERNEEYQRDHMMSIKRSSLLSHSKRTHDANEQAFFSAISAAQSSPDDAPKDGELRNVTYIRTLDFEKILKDHCAKLGIGFNLKKIETPQEVMDLHPECGIFVAADGAHSAMRKALLGENDVYKKDMLPSIDVKYEVEGKAEYMHAPTYDKIDMIVIESIGKEEKGRSQVALRFLVDEETFNQMPEATFKKPLSFQQAGMFRNSIREFQYLRENNMGEKRVEDSEIITKIKLSQYASKKFAVKTGDDKRKAGWFFAGDAAMGMPFYRSINSGLLLASQLGNILGHSALPLGAKTGLYNAIRPFKLAREFGAVAAKLSGIRVYKGAVRPVLRVLAGAGLAVVAIPAIALLAVYSKLNPKARLM